MERARERHWDSGNPLIVYPDVVREPFRQDASALVRELHDRYLHVVLVPAPFPRHSGHKIRAVENTNPDWYRQLWNAHARNRRRRRRPDSSVKRERILDALRRIENGHDGVFREYESRRRHGARHRYDALLRQLIFDRLFNGYEDDEYGDIPPHDLIRTYFRGELLDVAGIRPERLSAQEETPIPW